MQGRKFVAPRIAKWHSQERNHLQVNFSNYRVAKSGSGTKKGTCGCTRFGTFIHAGVLVDRGVPGRRGVGYELILTLHFFVEEDSSEPSRTEPWGNEGSRNVG